MATSTTTSKKKAPQSDQALALANGIPPNVEAMRKAAALLKITVPTGNSDAVMRELLGTLRLKMKELLAPVPREKQLVCQQCGERSTDDTEFCPFCGDLGISDEVPQASAGISNAPSAEPTQDVDGALTHLAGELSEKLEQLSKLKLSVVDCSYDMGVLVKDIHDRQLWRARGYGNFKQFAEKELPFSRQTAYQLVQIAERFDKATFLDVGYKKLRTIAAIDDPEIREQLLTDAKAGASARQLEKARPATSKSKTAKDVDKKDEKRVEAPTNEHRVTVLGRVDGKPKEAKFKSAKDGKPIQHVAKVTLVVADAYAEVEITEDVFLRIGLRVSGKDLVALSTEFVRAAS